MEDLENLEDLYKSLGPDFPWTLIKSYFDKENLQRLVRHQLESYNDFIERQIPNTINMFNPVIITSEHDYDKDSDKYRLEISITFENFGITSTTNS